MLGGAIKRPTATEPVIVHHTEEVVVTTGNKVPVPRDHLTSQALIPKASPEHPVRAINLSTGVRTQFTANEFTGNGDYLYFKNDAAGLAELTQATAGQHIRLFWDEVIENDEGKEQAIEITISPSTFPSVYRVTGETFIRSAVTGQDEPFQWTINKAKVSSEVTINLESEGDPATFELTLTALRSTNEQGNSEMMSLRKYNLSTGSGDDKGDDIGSLAPGSKPVAGKAKIPDQTADTGLNKTVSDLISSDTSISNDGYVTGTIFYNDWPEFGAEKSEGWYFPVHIDNQYQGQTIRVTSTTIAGLISGLSGTDTKVKESTDLDWYLKVSPTRVFQFEANDVELFTLNFSKATFKTDATKYVSLLAQEHNLGKFAKDVSELQSADSAIDANGAFTGTLNCITGWKEFDNSENGADGYFVALHLIDKFATDPVTVKGNREVTAVQQDWILHVVDKNSKFQFLDGKTEMFTLTFENATFGAPVGSLAIKLPTGAEDLDDSVNNAAALVDKRAKITWKGTNGTVSGAVKWYHFDNGHFKDKPTGHYVPIIIEGWGAKGEKEFTLINSEEKEIKLKDPKWIIRVDDFIDKSKTCTIKCEDTTLAVLDFTGVELLPPTGSEAFSMPAMEETFDGKVVNTLLGEDVRIANAIGWQQLVVGAFKKDPEDQKCKFPLKLNPWFTGKEVKIDGNPINGKLDNWVEITNGKNTVIKVTYNDQEIVKFTFLKAYIPT